MSTDMIVLDVETTGVDTDTARVVTAYAGILHTDGTTGDEVDLTVRPDGFTTPRGATAIHGITTEQATANGIALTDALGQILRLLSEHPGLPLAGMNIAYDLTLMQNELRRVASASSANEQMSAVLQRPILDALVLDRALHQRRRGPRQLIHLAEFYGVEFDGAAHGARADAIVSGRIVAQQLQNPAIAAYPLHTLHQAQVRWKAQHAKSLQDFLRRKSPNASVDPGWPILAGVGT